MAKKKSTSKKRPKKSEEIIHIKLEYDEAKQGKEDILNSQAHLLKIIKYIENYKKLRNQELKKKISIVRRIRELKANINKLKTILPKYQTPEILLKNNELYTKEIDKSKPKTKIRTTSLESQLEEIQRKLKALQEN